MVASFWSHITPFFFPFSSSLSPSSSSSSSRSGIAWESDVDHRFSQPTGFQSALYAGAGTPTDADCAAQLGVTAVTGVKYAVDYTPTPGGGT